MEIWKTIAFTIALICAIRGLADLLEIIMSKEDGKIRWLLISCVIWGIFYYLSL